VGGDTKQLLVNHIGGEGKKVEADKKEIKNKTRGGGGRGYAKTLKKNQ